MRLEDFVDKKVVIEPAGEHRPMEGATLVSVESQGIVVLVEGDPAVARPNEQESRMPPMLGLGARALSPAGDAITASGLTSAGQNKVRWNSRVSVKPTSIG